MSEDHFCVLCHREFGNVIELAKHDCLANLEYNEEYRGQKTAASQVMREMRERLGDYDPDDPTKVHSRRVE